MDENEQLLQNTWHRIEVNHGLIDQDEYGWWVLIVGGGRTRPADTRDRAVAIAAEYTREALERVRNIEDAITLIRKLDDERILSASEQVTIGTIQGLLLRERTALRRGMK